MGKLIFADRDATVHVSVGEPQTYPDGSKYEPHESLVLKAGETIPVESVPSYLKDLVTQGKAPGLSLRTEAQVKRALRDAALARGEFATLDSEEETDSEEKTE